MDYFLVLPTDLFEQQIRPALARSRQQRSFAPCRDLCRVLLPAARAYRERYHAGSAEPLLEQAAQALPFDRDLWKHLAGEVLLFAAVEIPEFQLPADAWCCLLAPDQYRAHQAGLDPADSQAFLGRRERFAPIQQALWGTHDLTFGAFVYRPDQAGLNLRADVERLARSLEGIDPAHWQEADLAGLRGCDPEDRAEELAYAQEWFPELRALFQRVRDGGQVLVHERIY
jgi:hypothetical protein